MSSFIISRRRRPAGAALWIALALSLACASGAQAGLRDFFGGGKKGGGSHDSDNRGGERPHQGDKVGGGPSIGKELKQEIHEAKQEVREAKKEVRENRVELGLEKLKALFTGDRSEVKEKRKDLEQSQNALQQAAQKLGDAFKKAEEALGGHHKPKPPEGHGHGAPESGSAGVSGSPVESDPTAGLSGGPTPPETSLAVLPGEPATANPFHPDLNGRPERPPLPPLKEPGLGIGSLLDKPHSDEQDDMLPIGTKDVLLAEKDKKQEPEDMDIKPLSHPTPSLKEKDVKTKLARRLGDKQGVKELGSIAAPDQEDAQDEVAEGDALEGKVVLPDGTVKAKDDAQVVEARAALSAAETKTQLGDYDGAIQEAERSYRAVPNSRALNAKAKAFNAKADRRGVKKEARIELYLKAIETAEAAIRLDARNAAAYEIIAWAKLKLGNYIGTIEAASHAIELKPKGADAYAVRAFAHEQLGHKEETLRDIVKAAELHPAKYAKLARAAKRGERIFDPDADEGLLSDSIAALSGRRMGPMAALGTLAALLGVLAGAVLLFRSRLAQLLLPEEERLKREMASRLACAAPPKAADDGLLAGKYQLSRVIGKGGMGQVWEAQDQSLGRVVAVKKMVFGSGDQEALARELYIKEARTLASLHHPNIVDIYEILDQSSGLYLVFELLSGKTVQHLLAERRRLPLAQVRDILKPVCEALDFAHGRGIVHRDLKPSNIMVTDQGYVKVMDFGIARRMEEPAAVGASDGAGVFDAPQSVISGPFSVARTRTIAGTPAYMAPEAENGLVSPKTDVYALGVCLYEMLTGELPFGHDGGLQQRLERAYVKAGARVSGLPSVVDEIIHAALDPNMETRLSSTRAFFLSLQNVRDSGVPSR